MQRILQLWPMHIIYMNQTWEAAQTIKTTWLFYSTSHSQSLPNTKYTPHDVAFYIPNGAILNLHKSITTTKGCRVLKKTRAFHSSEQYDNCLLSFFNYKVMYDGSLQNKVMYDMYTCQEKRKKKVWCITWSNPSLSFPFPVSLFLFFNFNFVLIMKIITCVTRALLNLLINHIRHSTLE